MVLLVFDVVLGRAVALAWTGAVALVVVLLLLVAPHLLRDAIRPPPDS